MSLLRRAAFGAAAAALLATLTGCTLASKIDTQPQTAITLGESWGKTLATRDAKKIAGQYAPDAVLLATFTNKIQTPEARLKYFQGLAKNDGLRVKFNTMVARTLANDTVSLSGLYTFMYEDAQGRTVKAPARYTFVWENRNGEWKVVEHHSSVRPEKK
jgi:uncharacterized protein (TIGR02246 family)